MAPVGRLRRGSLIKYDKSDSAQQQEKLKPSVGNKNKPDNKTPAKPPAKPPAKLSAKNDHQKDLVNKVLDKGKNKPSPKAKLPMRKTKSSIHSQLVNRVVEEKKESETEYDIYSDDSYSGSSFSSGSYDSDISSSYDSSDEDFGRRNILRPCSSSLFSFGKNVWQKFVRNWIIAYGYGMRLVEFTKSEKVTKFLAKVFNFFWIISLFIISISRDVRDVLGKAFIVISTEGLALAKVTGKHSLAFIKFASVELFALIILGLIFAYEKSKEALALMKKISYNVAMSPYWLGKAIVNIPWTLYDVCFENTEKLAPIVYAVLGWSIVVFVYIPILATILHVMDILTIEDLDTLGLKNLCIYLGLIREERGFWHVVKKLGRSIFFR